MDSSAIGALELLRQHREAILRIAERHGARNIRIFGSVVRGDAGPESDIDFLIDRAEHTSSWFPAGLVLELEEALGRKVDVVIERSLNQHLRDRIVTEARPL
jgi:predicted nucleotidyltransferase